MTMNTAVDKLSLSISLSVQPCPSSKPSIIHILGLLSSLFTTLDINRHAPSLETAVPAPPTPPQAPHNPVSTTSTHLLRPDQSFGQTDYKGLEFDLFPFLTTYSKCKEKTKEKLSLILFQIARLYNGFI